VTSWNPTFVETLNLAEMVALCAARTYRALHEPDGTPCACLCHILGAARIMPALPAFVHFQRALSVDPARTIVYEMRGARTLSMGELHLLRALARWQYRPDEDPQRALLCIAAATVRRIAAPSGRAFALQMAGAGLWLPERRLDQGVPVWSERSASEDCEHVAARLH